MSTESVRRETVEGELRPQLTLTEHTTLDVKNLFSLQSQDNFFFHRIHSSSSQANGH